MCWAVNVKDLYIYIYIFFLVPHSGIVKIRSSDM
jgi:hypothetical protein